MTYAILASAAATGICFYIGITQKPSIAVLAVLLWVLGVLCGINIPI